MRPGKTIITPALTYFKFRHALQLSLGRVPGLLIAYN